MFLEVHDNFSFSQIEEMYSVPESFLEIEVRNPQTHGVHPPSDTLYLC